MLGPCLAAIAASLQCDGYQAYTQLPNASGNDPAITIAFCWSHLRREFYDLAKAETPIATETLSRIAALYQIEAGIRGESAERRLAVRQAESRPLVENLHDLFMKQLAKLPGRSPTADAIRYAMRHWHGLVRFLEDGRIELDTNAIERAMRPIKLSRKSSLFAGSDEGGAAWARMASLIETCKLNLVNPQSYLTDVLTHLVDGWPQSPHRRTHAVALGDRAGSLTIPPLQGRRAPLTKDLMAKQVRRPAPRFLAGRRSGSHSAPPGRPLPCRDCRPRPSRSPSCALDRPHS